MGNRLVEQALSNAISYGTELLSRAPGLYPYAALILPGGERTLLSLDLGTAGTADEAERMLVNGLRDDAADGALAAVAWGYTVEVTGDAYTGQALKVFAEAPGETPVVVYVPFRRDAGELVFAAPVLGPEREPVVFVPRAPAPRTSAPRATAPHGATKTAAAKKAGPKRGAKKAASKRGAKKASSKRGAKKAASKRGAKTAAPRRGGTRAARRTGSSRRSRR